MTSAHFDSDGHLDLVIADDNFLRFAKGDGGGDFAPVLVAGAASFLDLVSADMDGDGDYDVVGPIQGDSSVADGVAIGEGDGMGSFPIFSPVGLGWSNVDSLAVADYDGDGLVDVAATDTGLSEVRALLNGSGWAAQTIPLPNPTSVGPLSAADLNADGTMDLVLAAGGDLWILDNGAAGPGVSGPWTTLNAASGAGEYAIDSGDLDLDGFVDVVTSGSGPTISVFAGQAASTLADAEDLDWPLATTAWRLQLEDVELDGDLDLVVLGVERVAFFANSLGSGLISFHEYGVDLSTDLAVGDFNGDGRADAATTSVFFNSDVQLLLSVEPPQSLLFAESPQDVPGAPAGLAYATGLVATDDQLGFHYSVEGPDGAAGQSYYVLADGSGTKSVLAGVDDPSTTLLLPDPDKGGATHGTSGSLFKPTGCTGTSPDHFVGTVFQTSTLDAAYSYVGLFIRPNDPESCCTKGVEPDYVVPRTGVATEGFVRRFAIGSQRIDCGGSENMIVHIVSLIENQGLERLEWARGLVGSDGKVQFDPLAPVQISEGGGVESFRVQVADGGVGIAWTEGGELHVRTSPCGETWVDAVPEPGQTILDYDLGVKGNTVHLVVVHDQPGGEQIVESSFSTDGGVTFSPAVAISGTSAETVRELDLVMTGDGAGAVAVWEDDRFGAGGIFVSSVSAPGEAWSAEEYLGCGESPGLVAGSGAAEQVAAYWTTSSGPRDLVARVSLDGGASWDAPIVIDDGDADVVEPVAAYEKLYDRFAFAWLADDGTGSLAPYFGGFRTQTLVPKGWQTSPSGLSFDVANFFDSDCVQVWVVLSPAKGSLVLPDGRDLLLGPLDAFTFGTFVATPDSAGAGQTSSLGFALPPLGVSVYAVAAGFDPVKAHVCDISGVVEIEL
ncbi:MAG: VCBS repeat-containing protein [Planctomycetota bacterium]